MDCDAAKHLKPRIAKGGKMPIHRRLGHELIIIAGLMLGSCMEKPERKPTTTELAAEANLNALKALRHGEALEVRLQRVEEQLKNRTS